MPSPFPLASNLVPFSRLSDRFVPTGYTEDHPLEKKLEMLAAIEGIDGVSIGYPCPPLRSGTELRRLLERYGLPWAVSDADIYTEPRFKHGSLSNPDPKIRAAALDRVKEAIDGSAEGGAASMNLWLGHDGFDYAFQGHYDDAWNWILDGLAEIAAYNTSDMPVCIEPKCKEPRANSYLANTGKALWALQKINSPKLGLTLDFGHSLAALENPAEAAVLALREHRLKQIHINDNRRDWDLDLVPGSATVWEHIEFYYWLRKLGYDGWFSADVFTYREDGAEALRRVVQVHRKCTRIADRLLATDVEPQLRAGRHLEMLRRLWDMIGG
ncbi:TIM barrel protein [bacterium]|nr:TIM barrel protein [bacterium]